MGRRRVVDTHALIWYLEGNPRLGAKAKTALDDPESALYLPAIALAEACWIVERGRTAIPNQAKLLAQVEADARIEIVPLSLPILRISFGLASIPEMHDRQIATTALWLGSASDPAPLLTRDESIVASGVVPVEW